MPLTRVKRSGAALTISGRPRRFAGANAYWLVLNDNTRGSNGEATIPSQSTVNAALDAIKAMGGNIVRVHTAGINYGNADGKATNNALMPSAGVFNETAFVALDYVIKACADRGLYLCVPFVDRWNYYHGGAITYAQLVLGGTDTDANRRSQFMTNSTVINHFTTVYLNTWFNRTNTITGIKYKDDPTIMIAELANEYYDADATWTSTVAAYIKSIAPNVLVADPTAASGKYCTDSNVQIDDPNIDIFGGHFYPRDHWHLDSDATFVASHSKCYMVGEYDWTTNIQDGGTKPSGENATRADWLAQIESTTSIDISMFWTVVVSAAGVHADGYELYVPTQNSEQTNGYADLKPHTTRMAASFPPSESNNRGHTLTHFQQVSIDEDPLVVAPVVQSGLFRSGFAGGGGQSSSYASPTAVNQVSLGNDTGGMRFSPDSTKSSYFNILGTNALRARQTDGVVESKVVPGLVFFSCGIGDQTVGGLFYVKKANTRESTPMVQVDKPYTDSAGRNMPGLVFNGSNNNADPASAPTGTYPRHYGTILILDEVSQPGYGVIYAACVRDYNGSGSSYIGGGGAWRIKVRYSDMATVEQVLIPGTDSLYIRSLCVGVYLPNESTRVAAGYSRLIVNMYDNSGGTKPLLVTNANAVNAANMTSATISGAPTNIENMVYVQHPNSGSIGLTVAVRKNDVLFSTNAFTAAAGSIAFTSVAVAPGSSGPENNQWWLSCGATHQNNNIIVSAYTQGGYKSGGVWNVGWRGTIAYNASNPITGATWSVLNDQSFSNFIMGADGDPGSTWWLAGINTPGKSGTSAVSAITTSPINPARMYMSAKGNSYISDNYGAYWYPSNTFGSAAHTEVAYDWWTNKNYMITTTGDWPLAACTPASGQKTFDVTPQAVIKFDKAAAANCWFDPQTGEAFLCGQTTGGHSVPNWGATNTLWGVLPADLQNSSTSLTIANDYTISNGVAAGTGNNANKYPAIMTGFTGYGTGGNRCVVIALNNGQGVYWMANSSKSWTKLGGSAFGTSGNSSSGSHYWDATRNIGYLFDRNTCAVYRINVNASGVPQTPVGIFTNSWNYSASPDGVGYLDLDEANNRLWISTKNGVWYINNASTAAANSGTGNATATPAATQMPGEIFGPMVFIPATGAVQLATQNYVGSTQAVYPVSPSTGMASADGPRYLNVPNPTAAASWNNPEDYAVTRDRGYRTGYTFPCGIGRNWDGSQVSLIQQGNGLGFWQNF